MTLALILLIAGLPLGCLACTGHNAPVVAECEDAATTDCVSHPLDCSQWDILYGETHAFSPWPYVFQVAENLVTTEAAYRDLHLQRGPPA